MPRSNSTVVVVAGAGAERIVAGLTGLANVRAVLTGQEAGAAIPELAARAHAPYIVHDADPLAGVASAWAGYFDSQDPAGTLEVAIETAVSALHRGSAVLPDYYVLLDPDSLSPTHRHWWLGVLAGASPSRVIPAEPNAPAVRQVLARLPAGRWWPDPPDDWLRGLPRVIPDHAGLPASSHT